MKFSELSDVMGVDIVVRRYANQNNRWTAFLEHVEVKDCKHSPILSGAYGNASSPRGAIEDYVKQIRGKWLVCNAQSKDNRQEFGVPIGLKV